MSSTLEQLYQTSHLYGGNAPYIEAWYEAWLEDPGEDVALRIQRQQQAIEDKIRHEIESVLGLRCAVKLVEPKTIERSVGKAKRVIDLREED